MAAIVVRRNIFSQSNAVRERSHLWSTLLVLAAVVTALMLRPSSIVWQLLPKLRFVQFPWRWMSILTIPFVYFVAAAFSHRRFRGLWFITTPALFTRTGLFSLRRPESTNQHFSPL